MLGLCRLPQYVRRAVQITRQIEAFVVGCSSINLACWLHYNRNDRRRAGELARSPAPLW